MSPLAWAVQVAAPTQWVLLVVAAVAAVVVAPSPGLLFVLQQRGRLEIDEA